MALKMTNREVDGTSVVTLDGRIVLGEESKSLREKLKGLIAYGQSCWQETAGLMANLDAVVTVDTSILHLVDGMRKPLYILSSGARSWRLNNTWFPESDIFANSGFGFDNAVNALIAELHRRFPTQKISQ